MSKRNPRWLEPDEHEQSTIAAIAGSGRHFELLPATPAQRKYRAWYQRKRAARLAAAGAADTAAPGDAARPAAPVEATRQGVSAMLQPHRTRSGASTRLL